MIRKGITSRATVISATARLNSINLVINVDHLKSFYRESIREPVCGSERLERENKKLKR